MSKQNSPSLVDFAGQSSKKLIVVINLITVAFLVLFLFLNFTSGGFNLSSRQILIISLILVSISAIVISTRISLRKVRYSAIEKGNKSVDWAISLPEQQKNKLNREVGEIAATMDIPQEQYSDLLLAYIVAEDLALRQIQKEVQQPLIRHARIGETNFDAILLTENLITCVEVTFLVAPDISDEKISLIEKKLTAAKEIIDKQFPDSNLKLLFVVVTQLEALSEAKLRSTLTKERFRKIPVNYFEISVYSFEDLQKIYTM